MGDVSRYGSESAHGYSTGFFNVSVFFVWAELPHSGAWYSVGA